jgi:ABC-type antimicrobial peptide transport system permease subunit
MLAHYAIKEIKRRKLRSVTNILGYVIAVSFLIILVTLAQGYNAVAAIDLNGIGTHFAVYIPASKTCPNCESIEVGPFFKNAYTTTFNSSFVEEISRLPGVEDASPYLMFRLDTLMIGGIEINDLATETTVVAPDEVVSGRYFRGDDFGNVMLDKVYADLMNLNVGDNISAFDRSFVVIGIVNPGLHSKPAGIAQIYGLIGEVQKIARFYADAYNFPVSDYNAVLVQISPNGGVDYLNIVKQSVLETLEFQAGKKGATVGYQCGVSARKVVSITQESAWATSIILLVSVTLFLVKSQFGSVTERTKEIGLLKAIGWANSDITKQISLESLMQGLAGGFIGIVLGYILIYLLPQLGLVSSQNLMLSVSPFLALFGLIVSLIGGIIAGLVPALQASRLQSAEALRRF